MPQDVSALPEWWEHRWLLTLYFLYVSSYVWSFTHVLLSHLGNMINSINMEKKMKQKPYNQTTLWRSSKDRGRGLQCRMQMSGHATKGTLLGRGEAWSGGLPVRAWQEGRLPPSPALSLQPRRPSRASDAVVSTLWKAQAQLKELAGGAAINTRSAQPWSPHFLPALLFFLSQ